jgi:mersacidin/lichenicidin family type 2 lantibiotic
MNIFDVVRAWKDPIYRASLSAEQRAQLPDHPAGLIELHDDDLKAAIGGLIVTTYRTCTMQTASSSRSCCV